MQAHEVLRLVVVHLDPVGLPVREESIEIASHSQSATGRSTLPVRQILALAVNGAFDLRVQVERVKPNPPTSKVKGPPCVVLEYPTADLPRLAGAVGMYFDLVGDG